MLSKDKITKNKKAESTAMHKLVILILAVFALVLIVFFMAKLFGVNILDFLKNLPFGGSPSPTPTEQLTPLPGVFPEEFSFVRKDKAKEDYTLSEDIRLYFITQSYKTGARETYYFLEQINMNGECKEIWKSNVNKNRETSGYICTLPSLSPMIKRFSEEFKKEKEKLGKFPEKIIAVQLTRDSRVEYTLEAELLSLRYYKIEFKPKTGATKYYLGEIDVIEKIDLKGLWETDSSFKISNKEKLEKWWKNNFDENKKSLETAFIKAQHEMQNEE